MLNLTFQPNQTPAADSGLDMTLPHSVQGAKSGDETHVAMNFSLVNKVLLHNFYLEAASFIKLFSFYSQL